MTQCWRKHGAKMAQEQIYSMGHREQASRVSLLPLIPAGLVHTKALTIGIKSFL